MQEFKLPDLGEGMQEAEIRRWLIKPGDTVKLDQPMVEVETDKAVVEVPSPFSGRVVALHGKPGDIVPIGHKLAEFDDGVSQADKGTVVGVMPAPDAASDSDAALVATQGAIR